MPRSIASFTGSLLLLAGSAFAQVTPPQIPQGVTPPIVGLTAFIDGGGNLPSPIYGPLSCTAPAYSYQGLAAYGWGLSGTTLCAVVNATAVLSVSASAVTSTVPVLVPSGTAAAPSVAVGAATLGLYDASGSLRVSIGGAHKFTFDNGVFDILGGTPAIRLGDSSDVSLSRGAANIAQWAAGDFMRWVGAAFADLGTPNNGTATFCTDCTKATPCAGGGNGALAVRINGAWDCNP